jgi:hypothetical protein
MKNQDHINGQASKWQPIETAPKTGEHILAAIFDGGLGFGHCGGKQQANYDVVHYWQGISPDEDGFYPSNGPDQKYPATHWMPLQQLAPAMQDIKPAKLHYCGTRPEYCERCRVKMPEKDEPKSI